MVDVLPKVNKLAASTLKMVMDSGIPFARKHMISVLVFDTVRPNATHTTMSTLITFLSFSDDCETTPASSALSMPQSGVARTDSPAVASPRPLFCSQVHQSVDDVFVRPETREGHVYNRREEDVEQEGREHVPLTKA